MPDYHTHKTTQLAFAAHIRNPDKHPKPQGIDEQRMQVYRDLFFNNINNLIKQTFPVLATLYNREEWQQLIRSFYQPQYNKTPYFTDIADEFVVFLKNRPADEKRPFVAELADYEWLELDLEKSSLQPNYRKLNKDLLQSQSPVISPLLYARNYQYPVHRIGHTFQPTHSQPCHLVVWRNRDGNVHFAELSPLSMRLLEQLITTDLNGTEALLSVLADNKIHPDNKMIEYGRHQLLKWYSQDIIINTQ